MKRVVPAARAAELGEDLPLQRPLDALDAQLHQTIGEQNAAAATHFAGQSGEGSREQPGISLHSPGGDGDRRARAQFDGCSPRQQSGANLRPLKVLKNRQRLSALPGQAAHQAQTPCVLRVSAVRKIQAGDIHPGVEKRREDFGEVRSRP